jgi:hypothetical protein
MTTPTLTADPTFSPRRRSTVTTVEIVEDIAGADPVLLVHHMRPTSLKLTCHNHHDGDGWTVDVTVYGPRVLKGGADGAQMVTEYIGMTNRVNPDRVPPEWIGRRVDALVATLPADPDPTPAPVAADVPDPAPYDAREHAAKLNADLLTKRDAANEQFQDIISRRRAVRNARPPKDQPQGTHTDALAELYGEQAKLYADTTRLFGDSAIVYMAFNDAASYIRREARALEEQATMQHDAESTGAEVEVDESAAVVEP